MLSMFHKARRDHPGFHAAREHVAQTQGWYGRRNETEKKRERGREQEAGERREEEREKKRVEEEEEQGKRR